LNDRFGGELGGLGDVDGDTCDELAIAADSYESLPSLANEGGVLVAFGTGTGCTAGPRFGMLNAGTPNAGAGRALAAADLDRRAVGGRMVNELVVSSNRFPVGGATVGAAWVVRGSVLATLPTSTAAPYPVTAFAGGAPDPSVLVGGGGDQFGTFVAAIAASATRPGIVLVGAPLSSDGATDKGGAVFGYPYLLGPGAGPDPGVSDTMSVRLGGESSGPGRFGEMFAAKRVASGAVIAVGAPASDAAAAGGESVDDGATFVFEMSAVE
jgi:hypothetical protein